VVAAAAAPAAVVPASAPVVPAPMAALPAAEAAPHAAAPAPAAAEPAPVRSAAPAAAPLAAPSSGPAEVSAVVPPSFDADYLHNPTPRYPRAAARLRESGRVLLSVTVSASGLPEQVEIAATSGSPRLDQAALDTVRRWRFVPARQGDKPVPASVTVPLVFRLEE